MSDMRETIESARKELREWAQDNQDVTEPHETIFEIADASVPVYYSTILEWAAENHSLALNEPELGPAFDGTPTPVNIIAANIFELLESELWEEWQDIEREWEEADESVDCQVCGEYIDLDQDDYECLEHGMICGDCYRKENDEHERSE